MPNRASAHVVPVLSGRTTRLSFSNVTLFGLPAAKAATPGLNGSVCVCVCALIESEIPISDTVVMMIEYRGAETSTEIGIR